MKVIDLMIASDSVFGKVSIKDIKGKRFIANNYNEIDFNILCESDVRRYVVKDGEYRIYADYEHELMYDDDMKVVNKNDIDDDSIAELNEMLSSCFEDSNMTFEDNVDGSVINRTYNFIDKLDGEMNVTITINIAR